MPRPFNSFPQFAPFIKQYALLEDPLLRAIADRGGEVWFSIQGVDLEVGLADFFKLPPGLREFTDPKVPAQGHRVWRMMIQMARRQLVKRGDMDSSEHDRWRMTAQGYDRIGRASPGAQRPVS